MSREPCPECGGVSGCVCPGLSESEQLHVDRRAEGNTLMRDQHEAVSAFPDMSKLTDVLQWLAARGFLSGSLGRGERTGKDIDVRLSDRHVQTLKRLLNRQSVEWDSPFMGSITWWPEGTQVEVSFLFPRYRTGDKIIHGVTFRT